MNMLLKKYLKTKKVLGATHSIIWAVTVMIQIGAFVMTGFLIVSSYLVLTEDKLQSERQPVSEHAVELKTMEHPTITICLNQELDRWSVPRMLLNQLKFKCSKSEAEVCRPTGH